MLYKDGDVLWHMPIRYWETQEPIKCTVVGDTDTSMDSTSPDLYVYDDQYGHCAYVQPADCWYEKDTAIRAVLLHKWLFDMRRQDETRCAVDRMMERKRSKTKEIE